MRGSGRYGNSGSSARSGGQMQHMSGQRMEHNKPVNYHRRSDPLAFDKEHESHVDALKAEGQWRWERDGSKATHPMPPHMFNEGQGVDEPRSYYQSQRTDLKIGVEKQGNNDRLPQLHGEDMDVGYDAIPQTFEGFEKKFHDDIMKLFKEESDAEDMENTRHREKISAINIQYQEQLAALRARCASRRDEILQKEFQVRRKQYQQAMADSALGDPRGPISEPRGTYDTNQYDSYRERARFLGSNSNARDHGFEPRGPYPTGRVYDTGHRYY